MATYDDGDFSIKLALDENMNDKLKRVPTDYAKAVFGNQSGQYKQSYRGTDLSSLNISVNNWLFYQDQYLNYWWLGTQPSNNFPHANAILPDGSMYTAYGFTVSGIVVCIR